MATPVDEPDVLAALTSMKPDLGALDRSWGTGQRQAVLEGVLAGGMALTRSKVRRSRWIAVGTAVAAVTAATLLLLPGVIGTARPMPATPVPPPTATPSPTPVTSEPAGCVVPSIDLVRYSLGSLPDERSEIDNGYAIGWLSAAMHGDVLAIQRPIFSGKTPVDTDIATVRVTGGGTPAGGSYGPATDPAAEAAAIACLEASAPPLPDEPDLTCQLAQLDTVSLRRGQVGPPTDAYGSRIVDSVQVDAGSGYLIVAFRLAEPTGPEGSSLVAWVHDPVSGFIAPVSPDWQGGGTPDSKAVVWGPLAREAAIDCLGGPAEPAYDEACYDLLDYSDEYGGTNANRVGVLWQTYHSAGRPHGPPSQVQAVNAGAGYWVIAAVVYDETSTWLAWGNDDAAPNAAPYGNFLHWAEITSPPGSWDGGPAPHGAAALSAAVKCLR